MSEPFDFDEHMRRQLEALNDPDELLRRLRKAYEAVTCPTCGKLRARRPTAASNHDVAEGYTLHRTDMVEDYNPEIHCPTVIGQECQP